MPLHPDDTEPSTIRAAVADRAAALGLTAYRISKATADADGKPAVSEEMLRLYLRGDNDLSSRRLDAVLRVLGFDGWVWAETPASLTGQAGGRSAT